MIEHSIIHPKLFNYRLTCDCLMEVHRDINNLPAFKNPAVTIGTFDGVHTGHLQVIHQVKRKLKLMMANLLSSLFIHIQGWCSTKIKTGRQFNC